MNSSRFIILDRDGVINEDSDTYIKCPEEWNPIPGSLEAIARFTQNGYRVVVITNQSGIARGLFNLTTLERIHDKMQEAVYGSGGSIDDIFFCPHMPEDLCECRKPKPGLFYTFAKKYDLDVRGIPAIGDSYRDIEAARLVGAQPVLVRTGKGEKTYSTYPTLEIPVFPTLYEVACAFLSSTV